MKRSIKLFVASFCLFALSLPVFALSFAPRPLHELILPALSFTNASVAEVTSRISEAYKSEYERRNLREHPSEVHFQIHPSCSNVVVNIAIGRAPVYAVLDKLCRVYNLEYEDLYDGYFLLAKQQSLPLSHRMYDIIPSAFSASDRKENDVAPFFMKLGVDFPEGASATYLPSIGKVILRNTITNIKTFEKCLSVINIIPYQVETTVQLFQVTDFDAAALVQQDSTPTTNRLALLSKSRELASVSTISCNDQTTTNAISLVNVKAKNSSLSKGALQFIAHPVVSPEGGMIQVKFQISMTLPMHEEELLTYETSTSLMMYHGASMLIWITPPGGADASEKTLCLVVTARLIGSDGKGLPVVDEATRDQWHNRLF